LRFATALQRKMAAANANANPDRQIEFRIGLNVGDVLVEHEDLLGEARKSRTVFAVENARKMSPEPCRAMPPVLPIPSVARRASRFS
jgi:hypothetical protein